MLLDTKIKKQKNQFYFYALASVCWRMSFFK